ncbi:MAG: aldo/keto reductase [Candidatus Omnitrophica bacterium]|nr:aldo/keto reductase [Candidatus Omnitrophota bacterium]MDD5736842.1 aldo/keto reductase [Candidatus Omnitrophota bacterium]
MEYRRLGKTGLEVSVVGFGCNHIGSPDYGYRDDRKSIEAVRRALDLGINYFDTADIYGAGRSEEILGEALKGRRPKAVISTKAGLKGGGMRDASPGSLKRALEQSLFRLKTDHVDIFLLHAPDAGVPIEESIGAIDGLVKEGKARFGGVTHAEIGEVKKVSSFGSFVVVQDCLNIFENGNYRKLIGFCAEKGLAFVGHSPFASGLLAKHSLGDNLRLLRRGIRKSHIYELMRLNMFAKAEGVRLNDLAMLWAAGQEGVSSMIIGTSSIAQLEEDVRSAGIRMGDEVSSRLNSLVSSFSGGQKEN